MDDGLGHFFLASFLPPFFSSFLASTPSLRLRVSLASFFLSSITLNLSKSLSSDLLFSFANFLPSGVSLNFWRRLNLEICLRMTPVLEPQRMGILRLVSCSLLMGTTCLASSSESTSTLLVLTTSAMTQSLPSSSPKFTRQTRPTSTNLLKISSDINNYFLSDNRGHRPCAASNECRILLMQQFALRARSPSRTDSSMKSTAIVGLPLLTAPTTKVASPSIPATSSARDRFLPWVLKAMRGPEGRYLLTGPFTTLSSTSLLSSARTLSLLSSCAKRGANRAQVLGMRVAGLTSMTWLRRVTMQTRSWPSLFRGLSCRVSRHWWVMSGRKLERSCFSLPRIKDRCSSALSRVSLPRNLASWRLASCSTKQRVLLRRASSLGRVITYYSCSLLLCISFQHSAQYIMSRNFTAAERTLFLQYK